MIKITLEFNSYAESIAALKLIGNIGLGDAVGKVDAPKPPAKAEAAGQAAAAKRTPAPAPAASSPAPTPSPAAGSVTPEQLTKAIVAAVTRAGRDVVVAHLKDDYGVAKGAEITDPEIRAACLASVSAL